MTLPFHEFYSDKWECFMIHIEFDDDVPAHSIADDDPAHVTADDMPAHGIIDDISVTHFPSGVAPSPATVGFIGGLVESTADAAKCNHLLLQLWGTTLSYPAVSEICSQVFVLGAQE